MIRGMLCLRLKQNYVEDEETFAERVMLRVLVCADLGHADKTQYSELVTMK